MNVSAATLSRSKKNGFALSIEMIVYLTVVSLLILAGMLSLRGWRETGKVQAASDTIQSLFTAAGCYMASGKTSYAGISIAALQDDECLNAGFDPIGGNPWGGDYTVSADGSDPNTLNVTVTNVPSTSGKKLYDRYAKTTQGSQYDEGSKTFIAAFN